MSRRQAVCRRNVLVAVLVGAMALVPVAVAWACNPQAHISLDSRSYAPGSSMTVYGSYFAKGTVTVTGPVDSTTVAVDPATDGGAFKVSLTAPSAPGSYTVTASRPTGGFAPASFTVAAPKQQAPAPSQPSQQQPSQNPGSSTPQGSGSQGFDTPSIVRSDRTRSPSQGGKPTQQSRPAAGRETTRPTTTTQTTGGTTQPVFSGSVSRATGGTFATAPSTPTRPGRADRPAPRGGGTATQTAPSEQSAFNDVWSSYQPGRTPSLMASTGSSPDGGTGSELVWGIGLLAVGMFSLVGGLAYTEARRRRVA